MCTSLRDKDNCSRMEVRLVLLLKVTLKHIIVIGGILQLVVVVDNRITGAPPLDCGQIDPFSPSNDPLPYSVNLSDFTFGSYIGGQSYNSKVQTSALVYISYSHTARWAN